MLGTGGDKTIVRTPTTLISLEEFLQQPEIKPAREYIKGEIIQKPMPQGKHSTIQTELSAAMNTFLKPQRVGRAFCELRCTFGGRSLVPDIGVFRWARIPRDDQGEIANTFSSAPDWTIEILSPDQSQTKVTKNILFCLQHGTAMGWLIDPAEQTVFVYQPQQSPEVLEEDDRLLPMPDFVQGLTLTVGQVFGWLME